MRWFLFIALGTIIFAPGEVYAKKGTLLLGLSKEYYVGGDSFANDFGQFALQVGVAYNLSPVLALSVAFESDLEHDDLDPIDQGISFGVNYAVLPLYELSPFLRVECITLFDPDFGIGVRAGPGVRFELFRIFGIEGAYLMAQFSFKALFEKPGAPYYSMDLPRVGFEYDF